MLATATTWLHRVTGGCLPGASEHCQGRAGGLNPAMSGTAAHTLGGRLALTLAAAQPAPVQSWQPACTAEQFLCDLKA